MGAEDQGTRWIVGLAAVSLPMLVVLALLGCADRPSSRQLQALAERAELERLRPTDFVEVSTAEQVGQLGGRLYEYQTTQGGRLLWVSTDNRDAHVLGAGIGGVGEWVLMDLDGDGGDELALVENHGSGLAIQRVVGYRVGEWAGPPAFAAYVSHGPVPAHLRSLEEPPRLEVVCGDQPLGWFQFERSQGAIVYEESSADVPDCRP